MREVGKYSIFFSYVITNKVMEEQFGASSGTRVLSPIGAAVAAIGLEAFLVSNHLVEGGVAGLSIISSHVLCLPIGIFKILLHLPFIFLGYKKLGKVLALSSVFGVGMLSLLTTLLHHDYVAMTDPILAAVFGGVIVGTGVGFLSGRAVRWTALKLSRY